MFKIAITNNVLQQYLDKLPISYYLGEKLEARLSETRQTSIDLINRIIYISPDLFNEIVLEKEPSEKELENLVRNALYHEVSHAILTPSQLSTACNNIINYDIINIFEDQRIETVLKDYYYRVDFAKFVKIINNYKPNEMPETARELFYQIVRYGELNKKLEKFIDYQRKNNTGHYWDTPDIYYYKDRQDYFKPYVKTILDRYSHINSFSSFTDIKRYIFEINDLYRMCVKVMEDYEEFLKQHTKKLEDLLNENDDSVEYDGEEKEVIVPGDKDEEEKEETPEPSSNEEEEIKDEFNDKRQELPEEQEEKLIIVPNPDEDEEEEEDRPENGDNALNVIGPVKQFKEELKKELQRENSDFYEKLRFIMKMYKSKRSNNNGSCMAHSGRLDSRLYVRDNNQTYKWFVHANGNQLKKGCKLHLNIFCDTSGSFNSNEEKVNSMLKELEKVENEMRDVFEFDIYEVDMTMRKLPKTHRRIKTICGGTSLTMEWNKILLKAQDVNNDTLNITLFDGSIYCKDDKPILKIFNKNNFINIVEESNAQGFRQYCKQARKNIVVETRWWNSKTYSDYLEETVLKVLHSYIQGR